MAIPAYIVSVLTALSIVLCNDYERAHEYLYSPNSTFDANVTSVLRDIELQYWYGSFDEYTKGVKLLELDRLQLEFGGSTVDTWFAEQRIRIIWE